jgi:hypothetical protein
MSKTATTDKETGTKANTSSCCGGPAPSDANACCVRDAEAKAAGASGCGCEPAADPKRMCCP